MEEEGACFVLLFACCLPFHQHNTTRRLLRRMHPPLKRSHPECQDVILAYVTCQEERTFGRWFGACTDAKTALDKCFKKEKENYRAANMRKTSAAEAVRRPKNEEERRREEGKAKALTEEFFNSEQYRNMMERRGEREERARGRRGEKA